MQHQNRGFLFFGDKIMRMKNLLNLFLLLNGWIAISAQPTIQWQKTLGGSDFDEAASIQQTLDGGYIIVGDIVSNDGDVFGNHGGDDFWVIKLDNAGSVQWKKAYGGSNNDIPYAIQQTNDAGYIVAGFAESNNWDVSGNHGGMDAWVVKLSSAGVVEWKKSYGGSAWEEAHSIQQTTDGGYIFAGLAQSMDGDVSGVNGFLDFWVVKISNLGSVEWQKALGGSNEDIANSIKQTSDGGYIVAGHTKSVDGDVSGNHGNLDYWVVKLSSTGVLEWQKTLGGAAWDTAEEVCQTKDGGYIVTGYAGSGSIAGQHGSFDNWVVKLSSTGDIQWQKALGGSDADYGRSIEQTSDGNYIVAGSAKSTDGDILENKGNSDAWLVKLNNNGEIIWQKTLGGTSAETFLAVTQTVDNGYIMAGYAWSNDGDVSGVLGYNDFWIVKLSPESSPTTTPKSLPLEIYPNPATHTISLQLPQDHATGTVETPLSIRITDLLGKEISQQTLQPGKSLDIAALPNGMYLLTATNALGKVFSGRFMKQE